MASRQPSEPCGRPRSEPYGRTSPAQAPSPCCFPSPRRPHTPAGCGHGGTRNISTSRSVHTRSVNPAAIAGVQGRHCLAEPVPLVDSGCGRPQPGNYPYRSQIFTGPNHHHPRSPSPPVWTDSPACRHHAPCAARSVLCGLAAAPCRTLHSGASHQLGV